MTVKIFTQEIENCLQCPRSFRTITGRLVCTKIDNVENNYILDEKHFPYFCPLKDKYKAEV